MPTKQCNKCGDVLEADTSNFYKSKTGKYGVTAVCKPCRNTQISERRLTLDPETERERSKKWRREHPEYVKQYQLDWVASGGSKKANKKWRDANLETARELTRVWQAENPEKKKQSEKNYGLNNPEKRYVQGRHQKLKKKYGVSWEEYSQGCRLQNNKCSLCDKEEESLCVDHCHTTNVVRGLLCGTCNLMLGYAQDDPLLLKKAALYLINPPGILKEIR